MRNVKGTKKTKPKTKKKKKIIRKPKNPVLVQPFNEYTATIECEMTIMGRDPEEAQGALMEHLDLATKTYSIKDFRLTRTGWKE